MRKQTANADDSVSKREPISRVYEEIELPGGLVDAEGVRHREVELDEMRGIDEETVTSPRYKGKYNLALHHMLARCVQRLGGITPLTLGTIRKLLIGDRDFLLLQLQKVTNGNLIKTKSTCSGQDCQHENPIEFNIDDIPIKELKSRIFKLELAKGLVRDGIFHKTVEIELPECRVSEEMEIFLNRKEFSRALNVLFLNSVKSFGKLAPEEITEDLFKEMSTKDRTLMVDEINKRQPGPEYTTIKYFCDKCGKENSFDLTSASFFG